MGDGAQAAIPIKFIHCCHSDNGFRRTSHVRLALLSKAEVSNDVPWGTFTKPTLTGWLFFGLWQVCALTVKPSLICAR